MEIERLARLFAASKLSLNYWRQSSHWRNAHISSCKWNILAHQFIEIQSTFSSLVVAFSSRMNKLTQIHGVHKRERKGIAEHIEFGSYISVFQRWISDSKASQWQYEMHENLEMVSVMNSLSSSRTFVWTCRFQWISQWIHRIGINFKGSNTSQLFAYLLCVFEAKVFLVVR